MMSIGITRTAEWQALVAAVDDGDDTAIAESIAAVNVLLRKDYE